MPCYTVRCVNHHVIDVFASVRDFGATEDTAGMVCAECGHTMGRIIVSASNTAPAWASEKRPHIIHNMGHDPVRVSSMADYARQCKAHKVEPIGTGKGKPGQWV